MSQLIQLVYASRATFQSSSEGVDREVARILVKSRINNPKKQIGGVLYFGNGYFMQALEGIAEEVDAVFAKIAKDRRHTDVKVILRREIEEPRFASWSMKYVLSADDLKELIDTKGMKQFDPYRFDEEMIDRALGILSSAVESAPTAKRTGLLALLLGRSLYPALGVLFLLILALIVAILSGLISV